MLAGNSRYFAFWYDVEKRGPKEIFGSFNVFLNSTLLIDEVDADFGLMAIASDLKKTFSGIDALGEFPKDRNPKQVFLSSLHEHGYLSFEDPVIPEHWRNSSNGKVTEFLELFSNLIRERRADPPISLEVCMGPRLCEQGWRFFLFAKGKKEVMLASPDQGRSVMKFVLPKGRVKAAISSFLNFEDFAHVIFPLS